MTLSRIGRIRSVLPWIAALVGFLLVALPPGMARAADVLILQGSSLKPYALVRDALEKELIARPVPHGQKTLHIPSVETILLSEEDSANRVREVMARTSPDVVVTIGAEALAAASSIDAPPVLFLLSPAVSEDIRRKDNVTGIFMEIPAELQLDSFLKVLPLKRIGIIHDPAKSGDFVAEAGRAARGRDVALVIREIGSAREIPARLNELGPGIDALWMIPDTTAVTPQGMKFMLHHSFAEKIPLLAFSEKYIDAGAALAAGFDLDDMGRQAAELARKILAGQISPPPPAERVRALKLTVNEGIVKKLGTPLKKGGEQ